MVNTFIILIVGMVSQMYVCVCVKSLNFIHNLLETMFFFTELGIFWKKEQDQGSVVRRPSSMFFCFLITYLFGCAGSEVQHIGSSLLNAVSLVVACRLTVVARGI